MKRIGIIGGGIIGLFIAYHLRKNGHDVTLFERGTINDSCSTGNAGMVTPSHIIPLAAPGMIAKGIRWMFDETSPFYIRPRLDLDLIRWGYLFHRSASKSYMDRSIPALRDLLMMSRKLYQDFHNNRPFDFGFEGRGIMMLYTTKAVEHEEIETAEIANRLGVEAHVLTKSEAQAMEPDITMDVLGATYYPMDAHLQPHVLVESLAKWLTNHGVTIVERSEISEIRVRQGRIQTVGVGHDQHEFDEYVVAAGSWSPTLAKQLELRLPMQAGKGYSIEYAALKSIPKIPSILVEARVAVTPMVNTLRIAGTMEIGGINRNIDMNRVRGIVDSIARYYPQVETPMPQKEHVWSGLRPCTPDGLPYIGRASGIKNLTVATGHAMMGLGMAPATGKLVSQLINGEATDIDIQPFSVDRFA
jgi:D-amino-acid dehydrogenase